MSSSENCWYCDEPGHIKIDCPSRSVSRCAKCHKVGHDVGQCDNRKRGRDKSLEKRGKATCGACGEIGHKASKCRQIDVGGSASSLAASPGEASSSAIQPQSRREPALGKSKDVLKKCGGCKQMGHVRIHCPKVVVRSGGEKCPNCGQPHDKANCTAVRTGQSLIKRNQLLGQPLLRAVTVRDHTCVTIETDIFKEDIRTVAGRMHQQHHTFYGGFVVIPKEPLPSLPLSTLDHLMVSVRDQQISARKQLGSFRMENSPGTTQRCSDFIREAQQHAKDLLQAVKQSSSNSYWHSAHELAEKFVRDGKGSRYVVDLDATLFYGSSRWVISRLRKTFLPYLDEEQVGDGESVEDQCRGPAMSGINTPHIMIGLAGSMTGFHVEDFNFCSVNYLHYGAPKHWIIIPSKYAAEARALFKQLFPDCYRQCKACDLHRYFFVFPQLLTLHNIPHHTIRQRPGEYVFTFPEALHLVMNEGFNVAEAINFVNKAWKKHISTISECTCHHKFELNAIKKNFPCLKKIN